MSTTKRVQPRELWPQHTNIGVGVKFPEREALCCTTGCIHFGEFHSPPEVEAFRGSICWRNEGELRQSAARYGRLQPVLISPTGAVIDGRLRLSIDPTWPHFIITTGALNPILADDGGRIIDGRARYEVDKDWPRFTVCDANGEPYSADDDGLAFLDVILELDRWHKNDIEKLSYTDRAKIIALTQTLRERSQLND